MKRELAKLANHLDKKGLVREANFLDGVLRKFAASSLSMAEHDFKEEQLGKAAAALIKLIESEVGKGISLDDYWIFDEEFGDLKEELRALVKRRIADLKEFK